MPHERPDDKLVADDAALDDWWEKYTQEKTREAAKAFGHRMPNSTAAANVPTFSMPG